MPKIAALGGLSSRGFGEFAQQTAANYIEDVFSTYLFNGTGASITIDNGIDLSSNGGLIWIKPRNFATGHYLYDTARGVNKYLSTQAINAQTNYSPYGVTSFSTNGYVDNTQWSSTLTGVSWTFRKAAKFFDVITYTGNGANRTISHNLGSVPGMIIIKRTDTTGAWAVYHNALANTEYLILNTTAAKATGATYWNSTTPTSTVFSLGTATDVNANGGTYVAYLYASNAGGFGADGSQNVISCGSFVYNSTSGNDINLGYESQFVLLKSASSATSWYMQDIMRGMVSGPTSGARLFANTANAEDTAYIAGPTATGFNVKPSFWTNGETIIYLTIRRGPMKTPTDATKVFTPVIANSVAANTSISTTNLADAVFYLVRGGTAISAGIFFDRLRGLMETNSPWLGTAITNSEFSQTANTMSAQQNTGILDNWTNYNLGAINIEYSVLSRAPGFFDVVAFNSAAASATTTVTHNLNAVPELIIMKRRDTAQDWWVYNASVGSNKYLNFNLTGAQQTDSTGVIFYSAPTKTTFTIGSNFQFNMPMVAYLFASCPGVSKVGSYTGTGATQTISCGFTGGARYVLIKRTDSTGDWWVWDTARGMVAGTDPRLAYNSTAAETNANWVYTTTGGFQIVTSDATVNANGGTYIYLAIA